MSNEGIRHLPASHRKIWWARRDLNPHGLSGRRVLSPPRLPVPTLARGYVRACGVHGLPLRGRGYGTWRRRADSNRRMGVLQTPALPLGYVASSLLLEREMGLEPTTFSLARRRSTSELLPRTNPRDPMTQV